MSLETKKRKRGLNSFYGYVVADDVTEEERLILLQEYKEEEQELRKQWPIAHDRYLELVEKSEGLPNEYKWETENVMVKEEEEEEEEENLIKTDPTLWITKLLGEATEKLSKNDKRTDSYSLLQNVDYRRQIIDDGSLLNRKITSLFRTRQEVVDDFQKKLASCLVEENISHANTPDYHGKYINRWDIPIGFTLLTGGFYYNFIDPEAIEKPTGCLLSIELVPKICEPGFVDKEGVLTYYERLRRMPDGKFEDPGTHCCDHQREMLNFLEKYSGILQEAIKDQKC